jgi:mono/diheme cytochrome c family protein
MPTTGKTTPRAIRRFVPIFLLLFSATLLRGEEPGAASSSARSTPWRDPADPSLATSIDVAKDTIQTLVGSLSTALKAAVESGGPEQGIVVCQTQALPLTASSKAESSPRVIGLKRTSLRVRNPANAPDPAEAEALAHVAELIAAGEPLPGLLVQEIAETNSTSPELRIYKPLPVAAQCLACHGDPDGFSPALRTALQAGYPEDAATGYAAGDWRGLIRVSVQP